jgi:hypothetical protein
MQETAKSARIFRFGVFEVDAATGELRKRGLRIRLQEQPAQFLLLLLDRAGEVVSREEIRRNLWPPDTFVDFDQGLGAGSQKTPAGARRRRRDSTLYRNHPETWLSICGACGKNLCDA